MAIFLFLCVSLTASAQFTDDFSDGDFVRGPSWTGDSIFWQVTDGKLQSRVPAEDQPGSSSFYLSTASARVTGTLWEFWMQLHFNPSSRNYVEVYLASDREDPRCDAGNCLTRGYFVRVGGTSDQVSLYRRDSLQDILLIAGRSGLTDHSNNIFRIKVTCDEAHRWSLYEDATGTGENYFREGAAADSTYRQSAFFSIAVYQSGKTAAGKHFFGDIRAEPFLPDTVPPALTEVFPQDDHHVSLLFSEPLEALSAENRLHYMAGGSLVMPDSAALDDDNNRLIRLWFEKKIEPSQLYRLQVKQIEDLAGNRLDTSFSFIYYEPRQYSVIIEELFPNPVPSRGLPEYEYAEIKNISGYPVNLSGWKFCDPVRCAVFNPLMLQPDSLLILCDETVAELFRPLGKTAGLPRFPSLNNTGDLVELRDKHNAVIHALSYSRDWFGDTPKATGGWALEMADLRFPCLTEGNWGASTAPPGGTPGRDNSISASSPAPAVGLEFIGVTDSANIMVHLNMGVDSLSASLPGNYRVPGILIDSAVAGGPLFDEIRLHLATPLQRRKIYDLEIRSLTGCNGLLPGLDNRLRFGLPEPATPFDVVINEVLFNPAAGGHDFVELYNRSAKIIDAGTLLLANRNNDGSAASGKAVTSQPRYLFPGAYLALTEDRNELLSRYDCPSPENIRQVDKLPPYPNARGNVVLLDSSGDIIDELSYNENLQSVFLHEVKGVSLERVNASGNSGDPANWRSASSTAGYATPGYLNSQSAESDTLDRAFSAMPEIFSPDRDGMDDEVLIRYRLPDGFAGEVIIFNAAGRPVRHLVANALLGTHGKMKWDGQDDNLNRLPVGVYVIYVRIFNTRGTVRHYKLPVVLANRR